MARQQRAMILEDQNYVRQAESGHLKMSIRLGSCHSLRAGSAAYRDLSSDPKDQLVTVSSRFQEFTITLTHPHNTHCDHPGLAFLEGIPSQSQDLHSLSRSDDQGELIGRQCHPMQD